MLTRKQLHRFVKMRNRSDFQSNLQFMSDAEACGFKVKDLGDMKKFRIGNRGPGYQWDVPIKGADMPIRMIEFGRLALDERLPGQSDEQWCEDIRLFEMVKHNAAEIPQDVETQEPRP